MMGEFYRFPMLDSEPFLIFRPKSSPGVTVTFGILHLEREVVLYSLEYDSSVYSEGDAVTRARSAYQKMLRDDCTYCRNLTRDFRVGGRVRPYEHLTHLGAVEWAKNEADVFA